MFEKMIDRTIEKRKERSQQYADFICNLLDKVENTFSECGNTGGFTLYKRNFKGLRKSIVPCFYHITDDDVTLVLDYSFILGKSFDDTNLFYLAFDELLSEKGISYKRTIDHVEYESRMPLRTKDMVIFQKKRDVKVKHKA